MAADGLRRKRRTKWVLAGGLTLLVGLVALRLFVFNDTARAVPIDVAVERYRDQLSSTTAAATTVPDTAVATSVVAGSTVPVVRPATLPAPGVYRYVTTGQESIDAVGGATHRYPAETTITVTSAGCGVDLAWHALVERSENWALCVAPAGVELQPTGRSYHQFFGQSRTEDLACDRAVLVVPLDGQSREAEPLVCTLGGSDFRPVWEVLEAGTRTVEGEVVAVQHVRMTVTDDDKYWEHITYDWYLDEHGLPVAITLTEESLSDTAYGDVTYTEQYTMELVSLTPLQ
ncbi:MAG: hypothetical protein Q7V88_15875 [Actinomycetota bacterium]|nr:hypothetical protein [Actinomycetota bacterium]